MKGLLIGLALGAALLAPRPGAAQFGDCAGIANPAQRLECYDRQRGASPRAGVPTPGQPFAQGGAGGSCTRSSPCVGPRGGVYYFTSSGRKQYLPR